MKNKITLSIDKYNHLVLSHEENGYTFSLVYNDNYWHNLEYSLNGRTLNDPYRYLPNGSYKGSKVNELNEILFNANHDLKKMMSKWEDHDVHMSELHFYKGIKELYLNFLQSTREQREELLKEVL